MKILTSEENHFVGPLASIFFNSPRDEIPNILGKKNSNQHGTIIEPPMHKNKVKAGIKSGGLWKIWLT